MKTAEQAPLLEVIDDDAVEMDPCLREAYNEQKVTAILQGATAWVRRSFEPMDTIIYDLFDRYKYIGWAIEAGSGYRAHAYRNVGVGLDELTVEPLSLDHAQTLLFAHGRQDEII